jgi:RNA polymerase sigma factor (sigma-70 family)
MSQNSSPESNSSVGRNLAFFNEAIVNAIAETVQLTLTKYAGTWVHKGYIDVKDYTQNATLHILNKCDSYDPERGASFKSWACTVARNYYISEAKKLKRIVGCKQRLDFIGEGIEELKIPFEDSFSLIEDVIASNSMFAQLCDFLTTLNESEQLLLQMMKDGLSKEEMIAITHKSGGTIDTSKSRLRHKILRFLKSIY